MSIIKTEHLSYIYNQNTSFEKTAVDDLNLEIEEGEFVGIIGHTGSGKSTLIQHFNALLKPTSGKIYIDGKDMWENEKDVRKFRFQVGLVFQYPEYQLFEDKMCIRDSAYASCLDGGLHMSKEELKEAGANDSMVHVDFMIGNRDLKIIAADYDGNETVLFQNGDWAI